VADFVVWLSLIARFRFNGFFCHETRLQTATMPWLGRSHISVGYCGFIFSRASTSISVTAQFRYHL
jgi:hypothetical protein